MLEQFLAIPFVRNNPQHRRDPGHAQAAGGRSTAASRCLPASPRLLYWINNWLKYYRANGVLDAIYTRIIGPSSACDAVSEPRLAPTARFGSAGWTRFRALGREADLVLAAETQAAHRLNREYLDRLTVRDARPRRRSRRTPAIDALRSCRWRRRSSAPRSASAACSGGSAITAPQYGTGYLEPIAAGPAARRGSLMGVGVSTSEQVQSVVDIGAPTYVIVKPYRERDRILYKMRDAETPWRRRGRHRRRRVLRRPDTLRAGRGALRRPMPPRRSPRHPGGDDAAVHRQGRAVDARRARRTRLRRIGHGRVPSRRRDHRLRRAAVEGAAGHRPGACRERGVTIIAGTGLATAIDVLKALALGAHAVDDRRPPLIVAPGAAGARGVARPGARAERGTARNLSITGCGRPRSRSRRSCTSL